MSSGGGFPISCRREIPLSAIIQKIMEISTVEMNVVFGDVTLKNILNEMNIYYMNLVITEFFICYWNI